LVNAKTGNGFVVSSEIITHDRIINVSPVHISGDLVSNVLNGERPSKLRGFEMVSVEKIIREFFEDLSAISMALPRVVFSNSLLSGGKVEKSDWNAFENPNETKIPAMASTTYHSELGGKRKTIFEYSVLSRFLGNGYSEGDFISKTERQFIDSFNQLPEKERMEYYNKLKEEMTEIAL